MQEEQDALPGRFQMWRLRYGKVDIPQIWPTIDTILQYPSAMWKTSSSQCRNRKSQTRSRSVAHRVTSLLRPSVVGKIGFILI